MSSARRRQYCSSRTGSAPAAAVPAAGAPAASFFSLGSATVICPLAAYLGRVLSLITATGWPAWARRSFSARAASARLTSRPSPPPGSTTTGVSSRLGSGFCGVDGAVGAGAAAAAAALAFSSSARATGSGVAPRQPAARIVNRRTPAVVAAGLRARRSSPAIAVLQSHHVVELRGRHLDEVAAVLAGDHAVPRPRRDVVGIAAAQGGAHERAVLLHHQLDLPLGEVQSLVLDVVAL